jgi:hypothetical protein
MKPASFTDRVLVTVAVGVSLVAASLSVLVIYSAAALGGWQNWLQLKSFGPLLQRVTAFLMLLGAAALDIAVWRPACQMIGRSAVFGTLRTRKKIWR